MTAAPNLRGWCMVVVGSVGQTGCNQNKTLCTLPVRQYKPKHPTVHSIEVPINPNSVNHHSLLDNCFISTPRTCTLGAMLVDYALFSTSQDNGVCTVCYMYLCSTWRPCIIKQQHKTHQLAVTPRPLRFGCMRAWAPPYWYTPTRPSYRSCSHSESADSVRDAALSPTTSSTATSSKVSSGTSGACH